MQTRFKDFLSHGTIGPLEIGMPFEKAWPWIFPHETLTLPSKKQKNSFYQFQDLEVWTQWPEHRLTHVSLNFGWGTNRLFRSEAEYQDALEEFEQSARLECPDFCRFSDYNPEYRTTFDAFFQYIQKHEITLQKDPLVSTDSESIAYLTQNDNQIRVSVIFHRNRLHRIAAYWGI